MGRMGCVVCEKVAAAAMTIRAKIFASEFIKFSEMRLVQCLGVEALRLKSKLRSRAARLAAQTEV
jgi:hypothetical protein